MCLSQDSPPFSGGASVTDALTFESGGFPTQESLVSEERLHSAMSPESYILGRAELRASVS